MMKIPESLLDGRVRITAEIVHLKWVTSQFGDSLKCLMKVTTDDGDFKLWGSVPGAVLDAARDAAQIDEDLHEDDWIKSQRITFTARIERSADDAGFGFYKRPSKIEITNAA